MPSDTPVTIPVVDPIVAFAVLLLQVPPAGVVFNVVVKPRHTLVSPVIAVIGFEFTVTIPVTVQVVGAV